MPECRSRDRARSRSPRSRRGRAACVVIAGVSLSHWPVSQTSTRSACQLLAVLARKPGSEGEPHSSSPSSITDDRDRQLAGDGLPGAHRREEGHQLTLVVLGAARDDHLAVGLVGGDARLERRRLPQIRRDRPAARRSGRRTARAARPGARASLSWATTIGCPVVGTTRASKPRSASSLAHHSAASWQLAL